MPPGIDRQISTSSQCQTQPAGLGGTQRRRSGGESLSMFQLAYPTIITEQMKALGREELRSFRGKDDGANVDSLSVTNRTCFYEDSTGQSMPMTLVETISFSTSDFADNFLTCPTCLCSFDEASRPPRLLPCSHTICRECLERILRSDGGFQNDSTTETIRCPVCREAILMPRGGLNQLPPSYLVNRLMDMIKKRKNRDYIPKCTLHSNETLLFCETCDSVFCSACEQASSSMTLSGDHYVKGRHGNAVSSSEHIVLPFSVAIKRVSEIVNYKSKQCAQLLDGAVMAVRQEMEKLETSVQIASDAVTKSFADIYAQVERRKLQLMDSLCKLKEQKMISLAEQLEIVQAERSRLEYNSAKLLRNPDIRKLTDHIQFLNSQVESGHLLAEPRENSFLKFEFSHNQSPNELCNAINQFGRIRVSNTYPPLCTAQVDGSVANVCCSVSVIAMDYNGNVQNAGGDPLSVNVTDPSGKPIEYVLKDSLTGSYNVSFLPDRPGRYRIDVKIFNRPIRGSPLAVDISEHNNPIWSRGRSANCDVQTPVGILLDEEKLYVLDTAGKQIIAFSAETGDFLGQMCQEPWITSTTTGACLIESGVMCVSDWGQKRLLIIRYNRETNQFTSANELIHNSRALAEPISVAFRSCCGNATQTTNSDRLGVLVALESDANQLHVMDLLSVNSFDIEGVLRNVIAFPTPVRAISLSLDASKLHCAGFDQYLHLCDLNNGVCRRILKGCYTALYVDHAGRLAAAKCSGRSSPACIIELFPDEKSPDKATHKIDSFTDRLRRPYGLVADKEGHLFCADFTGQSVKKYRYV